MLEFSVSPKILYRYSWLISFDSGSMFIVVILYHKGFDSLYLVLLIILSFSLKKLAMYILGESLIVKRVSSLLYTTLEKITEIAKDNKIYVLSETRYFRANNVMKGAMMFLGRWYHKFGFIVKFVIKL